MNLEDKQNLTTMLINLLTGSLKAQWLQPSSTDKADLLSNMESNIVDINDAAEFIRKGYVLEDLDKYFWIVRVFITNFLYNRMNGNSTESNLAYEQIKGADDEVNNLIAEYNVIENKNILHRIFNFFSPVITFVEQIFKSFTMMYQSGDLNIAYRKTVAYYIAILFVIIAIVGIIEPGIESIYKIIKYLF
jgi:hypothetical protein